MDENEQIILPEGYTRVEFLQSNGNEYLYLPNLTISSNDIIEWKQKLIKNISSVDGVFSSYNYSEKPLRFAANWSSNSLMINLFSSENNLSLNYYKSGSNFILSKNKLIIDNKIISENFKFKDDEVTGICLFTQRINNVCYNSIIKLYYWEVEGKCKLIPCLDDNNEPCMYDLVSQQAFYNQGSGRFWTNKDYELHYNLNPYTLPNGFKKCVYLQSNGTQWIDTCVIPNNETGIYFKALQLSYGNFVPFGVEENGNTIYPPRFNSKDLYYKWGETSVKMMTWDNADDLIFQSSLNFYNSKTAFFDSEDTDYIGFLSSQSGTYTYPIWLFSYNVNGSFLTTYGAWIGRIYRAQITQGNTLIRDYIPCLDADGRPCMWDSINDVAYYNQSGGTEFTYCLEHQLPSDFSKLKYLESTGTQYIKTDYVPTNTTGLYIDTQDVGSGDTIPMGLRESSSTNTRFFITRQTTSHSTGYGWGTWTEISTAKGSVRYASTLNWLNDRKSITNNPLFVTVIKNLGELPFTPSLDIWMFGINQGGSHAYKFKGRIYRAKISEGNEVVRDFVPALDTRLYKPCMYDLINNVAYYNDGSDEFLYGNIYEGTYTDSAELGCIGNRLGSKGFLWQIPKDYKRLLYLESNGTQWIDTGIVLNSPNIDFEIEFMAYDSNKMRLLQSGTNFGYTLRWISIPINDTKKSTLNIQMPELNKKHKAIFRNNLFILDGVEQTEIYNGTIEDLTTTVTATTKIFAFTNPTAATNYKDQWFSGRVYSCKLSVDGELLRNFIPCLDYNDTPCLYDTVTERTFYNQGTGDNFSYKKL